MPNNRSELDREISRVQKNTRNKIYRFRVKGVSDADIAAVDPRRSTKGMTTDQKRAYLRELQTFNGRDTGYTAGVDWQGNAGLAPTPLVKQYYAEERRANAYKKKLASEARRRYGKKAVVVKGGEMSMKEYSDLHEKGFVDYSLAYERGFLAPTKRQYGFTSEAQVRRAIESQKKAVERASMVDTNLQNYKDAIVNKMMEENAPVEVVTRVRNLTLNQLQYLYYNTDFSSDVEVFHYESYYEKGYVKPSHDVFESAYSSMVEAMDTAQRVVKSAPFTPLVG